MRFADLGRADHSVLISGDPATWARGLSAALADVELECLAEDGEHSTRISRYSFGDFEFRHDSTRGGAHRAVRPERLIRQAGRGDFYICFMLTGEASIAGAGGLGRTILRRRDIGVIDSTCEYAIEVDGPFDALWLNAPRRTLEARLNITGPCATRRIDGEEGVGDVISSMVVSALSQSSRIDANTTRWLGSQLLDLLCMSLPDLESPSTGGRAAVHRAALFRRARAYIEAHLSDEDLCPPKVADALAISTRYLSKLFEAEGSSVAGWIRNRRLERCRTDIENPLRSGATITEIAFDHGFRDVSSFNRAFRARFGHSPTALRRR